MLSEEEELGLELGCGVDEPEELETEGREMRVWCGGRGDGGGMEGAKRVIWV
jgi:hypothetical protein